MNTLYITGDTHIPLDISKLNTKNFPEQKNFTGKENVVVLGDFGLLWHEDKTYKHWLKWLSEKPFNILWLDGNHENHDWIDSLPISEWCGGNVHKIADNIIHLMRGQVFQIEGKKIFVMGGANSIDKHLRVEGISWWSGEEINFFEEYTAIKNLEKNNYKVDLVFTHTCPASMIPKLFPKISIIEKSPTEEFLSYVYRSTLFKDWYFGHWHEDFDEGKFHAVYNKIIKI